MEDFMKNGFAAALCVAALALSACSDDEPAATNPSAGSNGVCLQASQIDHTQILDDKTILFFMKSGHPWKNTMNFDCPSLKIEDGFAFVTDFPEICSNSQTIRVLRSGNFCELAQFTPYTPPAKP
jgi:hypothetical protein